MNEITWDYPTGAILNLYRFQLDGPVFLANGASDEVWGTGERDANDYDVAIPEVGDSGHYVGHFDNVPNIAAGIYKVQIRVRTNPATPVDSDIIIARGVIGWDGSAEKHPRINEIWDEVITKATHDVIQSAAKRLRQVENIFIIHEGTAQGDGGGNNTIELVATAHANNDWYEEDWIILVEGTGAVQMKHIDSYDGTSKIAVVGSDWKVKPDNTTDYIVVARSSVHVHRMEAAALAEITADLMAETGFTAGGSMTFAEQLQISAAWTVGDWRLKSGETDVYELLDADDGSTVILEMRLSQSTPYRTMTIKI